MSADANEKTLLRSALCYAKRGWPVLPLHTVKDGRCSCGNPECDSPGKHPRYHKQLLPNGLKNATTCEQPIRHWWKRWPDANVAIVTGSASGLVAIDVDPRNGGTENIARLEAEHEELPTTVTTRTGGGGRHVFFEHPGGHVKCRSGDSALAPGVEVKADGGYVVAPPSVHESGESYSFEASREPGAVEVSPMPEWLRSQVSSNGDDRPKPPPIADIRERCRNSTLTSRGGSMRRCGMSEEAIEAALQRENELRCKPPLARREVAKIAKSIGGVSPR